MLPIERKLSPNTFALGYIYLTSTLNRTLKTETFREREMIESPSPANVDWMGIVKGEGLYHQKKTNDGKAYNVNYLFLIFSISIF